MPARSGSSGKNYDPHQEIFFPFLSLFLIDQLMACKTIDCNRPFHWSESRQLPTSNPCAWSSFGHIEKDKKWNTMATLLHKCWWRGSLDLVDEGKEKSQVNSPAWSPECYRWSRVCSAVGSLCTHNLWRWRQITVLLTSSRLSDNILSIILISQTCTKSVSLCKTQLECE